MRAVILIIALLLASGVSEAIDVATISVSATVLSNNNCKFSTANATLNFGTLDPANTTDVTATATISVRCGGKEPTATFFIADDDGLYETGPNQNRMRHTTLAEYLPYSFSVSPQSATVPKNVNTPITISGTIKASDYQNAYVGSYTDTVVLTLTP